MSHDARDNASCVRSRRRSRMSALIGSALRALATTATLVSIGTRQGWVVVLPERIEDENARAFVSGTLRATDACVTRHTSARARLVCAFERAAPACVERRVAKPSPCTHETRRLSDDHEEGIEAVRRRDDAVDAT